MATEWYYASNGKQYGPVSSNELKAMIISGKIIQSDLVWNDSMPEWNKLEHASQLFPDLVTHPAPPQLDGPASETSRDSEPENFKSIAAASAKLARSAVRLGRRSLQQTFGDAIREARSQAFAAFGQVLKHPFRLSFVTIIFVLASWLALASLVGAVLFPVFVMGYIGCIRATVNGEKIALEGFIGFMRHGWDSFWHLLMMLAAFFVMIAAMLAPLIILTLLLYFGLGTVSALVAEAGSHSSDTNYDQSRRTPSNRWARDYDYPSTNQHPSKFSRWISNVISEILGLGLKVIMMALGVVILTPLAAALILFFYLVLDVSRGSPNPSNRFELVYDSFSKTLVMGQSHWKELLVSGLAVSICFIGIYGVPYLLGYLLSLLHLYVLVAWVFAGLVPAAMCFFIVFTNVFLTMTCLSLGERKGG